MPKETGAAELSPHEAIEQYQREVKEDPSDATKFMDLGAAFYIAHRWDDAIQAFEQAVRLKPDLAHAHYYLGVLYASQGLRERADQELSTLLQVSRNPILNAQAKARIPAVTSADQLVAPDAHA